MEKIDNLHVLLITSEWPSPDRPNAAPFIVRQVDFLRKAGVAVDVFPFRGAKNPLNYLRAWFKIRKKLSQNSYDLIHAQWGQSAVMALPKVLPLVTTFRGSDVEGIVDENGRHLWHGFLLSCFSHFVAIMSDEVIVVATKLVRKLPKRNDYHVIPSGLNLEMFYPINQEDARNSLGLPLDVKIILFGGDPLRTEKRFPLAQSVFELCKAAIPNSQLFVLQSIDPLLMPKYINSADVVLLSSFYEGSPNIVKEALACNVPIVSTDVGDVRERIGGIEGCVVCEDDRPETIAAALQQVLSRGKRINGRQAVLDLDERVLTQRVIQVYKKAIEKTKAR